MTQDKNALFLLHDMFCKRKFTVGTFTTRAENIACYPDLQAGCVEFTRAEIISVTLLSVCKLRFHSSTVSIIMINIYFF